MDAIDRYVPNGPTCPTPSSAAPPAALTVDGWTVHFEVGVALRVVGILGSASGRDTVEIDQPHDICR